MQTAAPPTAATAELAETPPTSPKVRRPHHPSRRALIPFVLLTVIGLLTWFRWMPHAPASGVQSVGTLEATEINLASEVTARVSAVLVEEGQSVRPGDVLVRLDDSMPQLQSKVADPQTRQVLQLQLEKYTLRAPVEGSVLRRAVQQGEIAVAGAPLLTLAEGTALDLTVYVIQADLGKVAVGQRVALEAEALPGEAFVGEVLSVSNKAEFTPRNAQTPADRLNLVFAVKVRADGGDGRLKPGMTVRARFE